MRLRPPGPARRGPGGEESCAPLYDAHAPVLLAYALRLTDGDRHRAEDIVQETLLRAWRNLDRLDEDAGPVRPWLFTVAQRLAIDAHRARRGPAARGGGRRARRRARRSTRSRAPSTGSSSPTPSDSLSPEHRAVIVETYYRGRSVAEAARVLGIPPGTVKSRCYYALRALKLALAERGVTT